MVDNITVEKEVEAASWALALGSDKNSPSDVYSHSQLREMRDYVANNWSFVPEELKEAWGTPDDVKSGRPLNLTPEQLSNAEKASKNFFNTQVEKVRISKEEEAKAKKNEENASIDAERQQRKADEKNARKQAEREEAVRRGR